MGKRREYYELVLKKYFNYGKLKDKQYKIIDYIVKKKRDVCAILATGFGKSLCYQLPFLITKKCVIVISPLLALMEDQYKELQSRNIPVCCLNSNNENKYEDIKDIKSGNNKVIYMTPEYFVHCKNFIKEIEDQVCCFAIDESHCISTWSDNSFRPEYKELELIREWTTIPILTLTATANNKVLQDIVDILDLDNPKIIKGSFDRPNLYISAQQKSKTKYSDIASIVRKFKNEFIIIYARTRDETEKISKYLRIKSAPYHAGFNKKYRNKIQKDFMDGKIKCIVATIAFGMGINNKHVRCVIHYGCPKNLDSYYQEIGRAGRDGEKSECYMLYGDRDFWLSNMFISKIEDEKFMEYSREQLKIIKEYCYTKSCRRCIILNHFGEKPNYYECKKCDNCCNKTEEVTQNLTKEFQLLLKLMIKLRGNYGQTTLIGILRGSRAKNIKPFMRKLDFYNKGKKYSLNWWKDFIRILVTYRYIEEKTLPSGFGVYLAYNDKSLRLVSKITSGEELILPITDYMNSVKPKDEIEDLLFEHFNM